MTVPGLAAAAAAVRDQAFVEKAVAHNSLWLEKLTHAFEAIGLKVTPSVANFVLIHFPDIDGKRAGRGRILSSRGYILRGVTGYGLPNAAMTVGTEEANRGVVEALGEFMGRHKVAKIYENIALIGIGLIGSSIARDIKVHDLASKVTISSRSAATLKRAEELGLGDAYVADAAEAVRDADLVIVSVPVGASEAVAKQIACALKRVRRSRRRIHQGIGHCPDAAAYAGACPFYSGPSARRHRISGPDAGFAGLLSGAGAS